MEAPRTNYSKPNKILAERSEAFLTRRIEYVNTLEGNKEGRKRLVNFYPLKLCWEQLGNICIHNLGKATADGSMMLWCTQ